jgi:hypothetical protein
MAQLSIASIMSVGGMFGVGIALAFILGIFMTV